MTCTIPTNREDVAFVFLMKRFLAYFILCVLAVFSTGCGTKPLPPRVTADQSVLLTLTDGSYTGAQELYLSAKESGSLSAGFISRYDQYFKVVALYDYPYTRLPKEQYRYASCADLTEMGQSVVEWRSIAARGNPFILSEKRIASAQEVLKSEGLWNAEVDGIASAEFQKAIMYYRLLNGMNVECVLYPHNLMLKSTFCSLFSADMRCQQGYEF